MAAKKTAAKRPITTPEQSPNPDKFRRGLSLLQDVDHGRGRAREGKYEIGKAFLALVDEGIPAAFGFTAVEKFVKAWIGIALPTITRWAEPAKVFALDVYVKHGTTKLSDLLAIAPLIKLSPIPPDPSEVMLNIPAGKGKPPQQKKFGECSKRETGAARKALQGPTSHQVPGAVSIVLSKIQAAYHQALPHGPDLLKARQDKKGEVLITAAAWVPLTRDTGEAYVALGKAIIAAAEQHPETVESHAPAAPVLPASAFAEEAKKDLEAKYADPKERAKMPDVVKQALEEIAKAKEEQRVAEQRANRE